MLWTNNGTPNVPDWWADLLRDTRLRFDHATQQITQHNNERERAA
jgi:hypothetical protein